MGHERERERWAMFHENEVAVKESGREGKEEEGWETTVFSLRIERGRGGSGVKKGLLRIEEQWRSNGHHHTWDLKMI